MLIITICRGVPKRRRLALWLFRKAFPGVSLIFRDPFQLDLTTIHLPPVLMVGEIVEPDTLKARHEIKITINPGAEEPKP